MASPAASLLHVEADRVLDRLGPELGRLAGRSVLITGAGGFLGGFLAQVLARANQAGRLAPLARLLLVARRPPEAGEPLAELAARPGVELVLADLAGPASLAEPAGFIIHAASPAAPGGFLADPAGTLAVNTVGLAALLEKARQDRAESVLYLSSAEVYGRVPAEAIPTPEGFLGPLDHLDPRQVYAAAKRAGEAICLAHHRQRGLPVKVARIFHLYGPGLRATDQRLIPDMIKQGLTTGRLRLRGSGRATRTYGYVADAAGALLRLLLSGHDGTVVNVGAAGPELSVGELAQAVARAVDVWTPVELGARPQAAEDQGAPERVRPDVARLRRLLDFTFETGLEEGLARTVAWCRRAWKL